jgi:hypothetical protein
MPPGTPFQPLQRSFQGVACGGEIRSPRHHVIERHRDVGAEGPLDLGGALGGEEATRAVHVALELDALVIDPPEPLEGEDLEPARVGEQRPVPPHEAVQAAEPGDDVLPGADVEVVGVREHEVGPDGFQVRGRERAHGALRADGHEARGRHRAVGEGEAAGAR